jgi:hypothetical protein
VPGQLLALGEDRDQPLLEGRRAQLQGLQVVLHRLDLGLELLDLLRRLGLGLREAGGDLLLGDGGASQRFASPLADLLERLPRVLDALGGLLEQPQRRLDGLPAGLRLGERLLQRRGLRRPLAGEPLVEPAAEVVRHVLLADRAPARVRRLHERARVLQQLRSSSAALRSPTMDLIRTSSWARSSASPPGLPWVSTRVASAALACEAAA